MEQDSKTPLLDQIKQPNDIQSLHEEQLIQLAAEVRHEIISTVSRTGGHLAPSLGVVELTLALLAEFDFSEDKLVWDVGHQAYAWKLLTDRRERFHTLRTKGGIAGFPNRSESPYDHFGVGHSSTSISAALGMAVSRDLSGKDHHVISVIGDGSMTAGLAFEGLNQAGHMDRKMLVILNDNEMSISKNVGAMSAFLSRQLSSRIARRFKKDVETILSHVPAIGEDMLGYAKRSEHSLKSFFTPGMLFEAFQFNYMGPIDGHDIKAVRKALALCKDLDEPVLLHVLTKKGKGYEPAETNPTYFHGVGSFEPETGQARKFASDSAPLPSYTQVFGDTLCTMADRDDRVIAITAAMPEGTGTACFAERHAERFVDVGICEQHAVTFAAGLAMQGHKPFVAIYSTFMQRAYDQIVHDVCLQNLPVTLCLDRGGLVGEDGATHHGAFDLSYLRHIPNLTVLVPADEAELPDCMQTALEHDGPVAIRYPRGAGYGVPLREPESFPIGQGEFLVRGEKVAVIAVGSRVHPALEAALELAEKTGVQATVFNARCVKPLPQEQLKELAQTHDTLLLLEENSLVGGFSAGVLEFLADQNLLCGKSVKRLGLPDSFVEHGKQKELRAMLGIDKDGIYNVLQTLL